MGRKHGKKRRKNNSKKTRSLASDLIIAIDRSKKRKTMYSFVSIKDTNLPKLSQGAPWLSHLTERTKKEKKSYINRFPDRFQKIKPLLEDWKIDPEIEEIKLRMQRKHYKLAVIDDDLYERGKLPTLRAIKESIGKKQPYLKPLINLADNLAYIGREEYEHSKNIRELKEKLRKLGII